MDIQQVLVSKKASTEQALIAFDQLDVVPLDFMIGRWSGFEFEINPPYGWIVSTIKLVWQTICRSRPCFSTTILYLQ